MVREPLIYPPTRPARTFDSVLGERAGICTIRKMRRLVALLIMLVIPLQFTWAAVLGVHGHIGTGVAGSGFHVHAHHHHHEAGGHPDSSAHGGVNCQDHDEGSHQGHVHPVFTSLPMEAGWLMTEAAPSGPIPLQPTRFLSRTPPLLDRPPIAHA